MGRFVVFVRVGDGFCGNFIDVVGSGVCSSLCFSVCSFNCVYFVVAGCSVDDILLGLSKAIVNGYCVERFWVLNVETLDVIEFDLSGKMPRIVRYSDVLLGKRVVDVVCASDWCRDKVSVFVYDLIRLGVKKIKIKISRVGVDNRVRLVEFVMPTSSSDKMNIVSYLRIKQIQNCVNKSLPTYNPNTNNGVENCLELLVL